MGLSEREIFRTRPVIARYAVTADERTDDWLARLSRSVKFWKSTGYSPAQAVAFIVHDSMKFIVDSENPMRRAFRGGRFELSTTSRLGPTCIDRAVLASQLLTHEGVEHVIESEGVGPIRLHYFVKTAEREIIDYQYSCKQYPFGFFPTREHYDRAVRLRRILR